MATAEKVTRVDYWFWMRLRRADLFQAARPCWKYGRLLSVLSEDGKHIRNVRPEDGLTPSEAR